MHYWIVTHLDDSPSVGMIRDAIVKRDGTVDVIRVRHAHLDLSTGGTDVLQRVFGTEAGTTRRPDAVITRLGGSAPAIAHDVVRIIESCGIPCVNAADALIVTTDKIRSLHHLSARGLPVPRTISLGSEGALEQVEARLGPPPYILKLPISVQGIGVAKIDSMSSLRSTIDMLRQREGRLIVQEFIAEASGADIRVLVLSGRAIAAMRRESAPDEFRSNLHRGGSATAFDLPPDLRTLAEEAAESLGLRAAGVDIILAHRGPMIIEVNASPGLKGIQSATTIDLAAAYVDAVAEAAQISLTTRTGRRTVL